jgi:hypothetical protein
MDNLKFKPGLNEDTFLLSQPQTTFNFHGFESFAAYCKLTLGNSDGLVYVIDLFVFFEKFERHFMYN